MKVGDRSPIISNHRCKQCLDDGSDEGTVTGASASHRQEGCSHGAEVYYEKAVGWATDARDALALLNLRKQDAY